jgi:hypothetical protein
MTDTRTDPIERLLREDARRPVPDAGFTQRVATALPPPRARAWLRPALVLGSAALGGALAWLFAPAGISLTQGFLDLARLQSQTPSALAAIAMALTMAVAAAVLAAEEN